MLSTLLNKSGLTVDRVMVETRGVFFHDQGKLAFRVHQTNQIFPVSEFSADEPADATGTEPTSIRAEMVGWKEGKQTTLRVLQMSEKGEFPPVEHREKGS